MPRLVLWPTASMVASTLAPDARSHGMPRRGERRRRDPRASLEIGDAHADMVIAEAMHVARLQRIELGKAGIMKGSGNLLGCERPRHAPSWPRGALDCSVGPRQASRNGATIESAMRVRVTRCSPCHAGIEFTSSTRGAPVAVLDDVDAGIIGADARRGTESKIGKLLRGDRSLGAGALLDIGDPARSVPDHGRRRRGRRRRRSASPDACRLRRRDELLQIIDAVHLLRRGEIVRRGDQAQAFALRAEQRLLHELAAFVRASPERSRAPPRRDRRRSRSRASGCRRCCRKKVVVDLSTQRSMARASFHTVTPSSRKAWSTPR